MKLNGNPEEAVIEVENLDDLWHLKSEIEPGDTVVGRSRRTKKNGEEKKSLSVKIEVEKMDYQDTRLRLTGEMRGEYEGVDIGYHSLNVEVGTELRIYSLSERRFNSLDGVSKTSGSIVGFCIVSADRADFFKVRDSGVEKRFSIENNRSGKMYDETGGGSDFRGRTRSKIEKMMDQNVDAMVVAGPGFEKNDIAEDIERDSAECPVYIQDTSVTGKRGLHECFNRGVFERVEEDSRIDSESQAVNRFLEKLKTGEKVTYGLQEVSNAVEMGAAKELILTVEAKRSNPELVSNADNTGAEITTVHTDHEPGKRIENLGGAAAVLRYRIS